MNSSSNALRRDDAEQRFDVETSTAPSPARHTAAPVAVQVWDPALRIFHWLLAVATAAALVTGEVGGPWIEWHGRAGELIAGLLAFRLTWGVIGAPTARFTGFVRGPAAIRRYLRGDWQGIGHNPLGALAVLALLLLGMLQVTSGLFANDDIAFQGPLAGLVSSQWSDRAGGLHQKLSWLLIGMVGLHLLAIAWYRLARKDDLIGPMLHGRRGLSPDVLAASGVAAVDRSAPARFSAPRLLLAAAVGTLTVGLVSGALLTGGLITATATPTGPAQQAQQAQAPARPAW